MITRSKSIVLAAAISASALMFSACTMPNLVIARKALTNKDFVKAKLNANEALKQDSLECEAYLILGQAHQQLNEISQMARALHNATNCTGAKASVVNEAQTILYQAWAGAYNTGVEEYNAYVTTKDKTHLTKSLASLTIARELEPELTDPLTLMGLVHEMLGDTNSAIGVYEQWYEAELSAATILQQRGITLGQRRGEVLKKLGTPISMRQDSVGSSLIASDKFDLGGRDLFIFSSNPGTDDFKVIGWTYNPPASLPDRVRSRSREIRLTAIRSLAFLYYDRKQYDTSAKWIARMKAWDPANAEAVDLEVDLLRRTKGKQAALKEVQELVKQYPTNVSVLLTAADINADNDRREEAVVLYKQVLAIEPMNDGALYSIAATYKNIAGTKQAAERNKRDADAKYRVNDDYLADLQTSAEYYEKLHKLPKYVDDLDVIEQLGNIYEVRGETNKVKVAIQELEALESKYSTSQRYYYILEGFYQRNGMKDKVKAVQQKGAKL